MEQAQFFTCVFVLHTAGSFLILGSAAIRANVVTVGPTSRPNLVRPEGGFMEKCPNEFPFPFDNGKKCCRSIMKENDITLATDCDGGKIGPLSSSDCCWKQMYVECSDQIKGCNTAIDTCEPSASIYHSGPTWGNQVNGYGAQKVLSFDLCETDTTLHIAPNQEKNHLIIFDFGCEVAIKEFVFRNTRNRGWNDRGTKNFTVETSYDLSEWTMVIDEVMPTAIGINICEIPLNKYPVPAHGRYVRFIAVDHYGYGSGLNYATWKFVT